MNNSKYKGLIVKQVVGGEKLEMTYQEYVEYLTTRKRSKKKLDEAKEIAADKFDKILNTKYKNELNSLLIDRYNLYSIPSFIFVKLGQISNGTFKGMTAGRGIKTSEILRYMKAKGKFLTSRSHMVKFEDNIGRLNYELSIVISDYPKFKKESLNKVEFDDKEFGKYKKVKMFSKNENIDEIVCNDIIKDIWGGC